VIGEATGRDVKWDKSTRTITIGPAPSNEADLEAFYRAFTDANNREDLEAVMAAFHPESPLLEDGLLEAEARNSFENYDVVNEIELFEVIEAGRTEAVLHTVEKSVNTNGRFHMDRRMEVYYTLLKDERGEWKIYGLEVLDLEYLLTEERLTAEADIDAELEKAIRDVVMANVEASEKEDLQALMATVDPESPVYEQTKELMGVAFLAFDLEYDLEQLNVIDVTDKDAYVYTVTTTKKADGPAFGDNRAWQVHLLKKQADMKLETVYVLFAQIRTAESGVIA